MARPRRLAAVLIMWGVCSGAVTAGPRPAPRVYLSDSVAHHAVLGAILGAQLRLARTDCRQLLTDFTDESGRVLLADLEATGLGWPEYAVERVSFVDGSEAPQCRKSQALAAFTEPGAKVVFVCAAHFAKLAHRTQAEVLIIHELLHTLGLGENPPSSQEITQRVTKRCGGS